MKNIKHYKIKIKSGDLSDDWIKIISKEFSQEIYRILQNPTQTQEGLLNLRPFQGFNQYLDVAHKNLTDFQNNTSSFNEKYLIQEKILLQAKDLKNSSWYFDAEILNVLVNGSEKQFLKIPVMPNGACVYHALGIDPDVTFFQSLIKNILKIEDSNVRWRTLLSLINNDRENLPGVDLQSYKKAIKNNFEENLGFKKKFTQEFAQEIAQSLENARNVDAKMQYTLNMADNHLKNTLEQTLSKHIETFELHKESDKLQINFQHEDSFKIVLYKKHWCPIFNTHTNIPLRYLEKETLDELQNRKSKYDPELLKDSPVE